MDTGTPRFTETEVNTILMALQYIPGTREFQEQKTRRYKYIGITNGINEYIDHPDLVLNDDDVARYKLAQEKEKLRPGRLPGQSARELYGLHAAEFLSRG